MDYIKSATFTSHNHTSTDVIASIKQLLEDNKVLSNKNYLDSSDACIFLGVAKSYLYKLTHSKAIPYFKTGKKIYFNREDLESYITKYRFYSKDELTNEANKHFKN